jgi:hypothetical protein
MKRLALLVPLALLAACAGQERNGTPAGGSDPATPPTGSAGTLTALDLLECDAVPSEVGGAGEDLAIGGGGDSPEDALEAFLESSPYVIPRARYEPAGQSGGRHAFAYRSDGEIKVVVVVSPRFGELMGAAFTVEELRTCPDAEFGSDAVFGDDRRVWTQVETGLILTDIPGPQHCGWQSARILHLPHRDGSLWKQYVRDPEGVFADVPMLDSYAEDAELPADATDSGYRSPEGFELWFTSADTAAYVVTPESVERWPRPANPIGCA